MTKTEGWEVFIKQVVERRMDVFYLKMELITGEIKAEVDSGKERSTPTASPLTAAASTHTQKYD